MAILQSQGSNSLKGKCLPATPQGSPIRTRSRRTSRASGFTLNPPPGTDPMAMYGFEEHFEETSLRNALLTYLSYFLLAFLGHIHELLRSLGIERLRTGVEPAQTRSFVPLYNSFESFFTRNIYRRVRDSWNRPVGGVPGARMEVLERTTHDYNWNLELTGRRLPVINMGSYNYLGFSASEGPCADAAEQSVRSFGVGIAGSRAELGQVSVQSELERTVARFLGQEDALVFQMGFATNSLNLPTIINKNCCVISDALNHASLVMGMRLSGATIKVFAHNNMRQLERRLREAVTEGNPRTARPFKKILIVVEGIYSMEGSMVKLPEVVRLKKKYRAYLYLDEAHSIGALGPHGRGVIDYFGLDYRDVDILMGTFTKSFGSAGGYIAGSRKLIQYLKKNSHSSIYGCSMSAPVAQQAITSMRIIMGEIESGEGQRRMDQLAWNTRYFRRRLHELGYLLYGNKDSPVVPMLLYMPAKVIAFSREMLQLGVGVVVAGYPATGLVEARVRFCLSAAHTKRMLDEVIDAIEKVSKHIYIKYSKKAPPKFSEKDPSFRVYYLNKCFDADPDFSPLSKLPKELALNSKEAIGGSVRNGFANGHLAECAEEDSAPKLTRRSQRATASPTTVVATVDGSERDSGNPGTTSDSQSSSEESEPDPELCGAAAKRAPEGIATHLGPVIANPDLLKPHDE